MGKDARIKRQRRKGREMVLALQVGAHGADAIAAAGASPRDVRRARAMEELVEVTESYDGYPELGTKPVAIDLAVPGEDRTAWYHYDAAGKVVVDSRKKP